MGMGSQGVPPPAMGGGMRQPTGGGGPQQVGGGAPQAGPQQVSTIATPWARNRSPAAMNFSMPQAGGGAQQQVLQQQQALAQQLRAQGTATLAQRKVDAEAAAVAEQQRKAAMAQQMATQGAAFDDQSQSWLMQPAGTGGAPPRVYSNNEYVYEGRGGDE